MRHTQATKEKISASRRGIAPWNKGKHHLAGIPKPWKSLKEEKSPSWKGDKVSYRGLHIWVETKLGKPSICSNCKKKAVGHGMHWANRSGRYLRLVSDWIRLCPKCHKRMDIKRIKKNQ